MPLDLCATAMLFIDIAIVIHAYVRFFPELETNVMCVCLCLNDETRTKKLLLRHSQNQMWPMS